MLFFFNFLVYYVQNKLYHSYDIIINDNKDMPDQTMSVSTNTGLDRLIRIIELKKNIPIEYKQILIDYVNTELRPKLIRHTQFGGKKKK